MELSTLQGVTGTLAYLQMGVDAVAGGGARGGGVWVNRTRSVVLGMGGGGGLGVRVLAECTSEVILLTVLTGRIPERHIVSETAAVEG